MATTNIFDAVLGKKAIKWDAFWHLFEWLLDESEGHGLGNAIKVELLRFAFDRQLPESKVKREHPVLGQKDGKGLWADLAVGFPDLKNPTHLIVMDDIASANSGARRKLTNFLAYSSLAVESHPGAIVRAIAITDAPEGKKLKDVVYESLGPEASDFLVLQGWKLLPLQTIGGWIANSLKENDGQQSSKMKAILTDLIAWCDVPVA